MIEQMKTGLKLETDLVELRKQHKQELELVNKKYRQLLVLSKYYESQLTNQEEKYKTEVLDLHDKQNLSLEVLKEKSRNLIGNKNFIIKEKTEECEKLKSRVLELEEIVNDYEIV